jgi:hypothetical protein
MESELDLNDRIDALHILATNHALYQIFLDLNTVDSLLSLLDHANIDISLAVLSLLSELTEKDVGVEDEEDEPVKQLTEQLLSADNFQLLVHMLSRIWESRLEQTQGEQSLARTDFDEGLGNFFGMIDNVLELSVSFAAPCLESAPFISLIVDMALNASSPPISSVELQAAELLDTLLVSFLTLNSTNDNIRDTISNSKGWNVLTSAVVMQKYLSCLSFCAQWTTNHWDTTALEWLGNILSSFSQLSAYATDQFIEMQGVAMLANFATLPQFSAGVIRCLDTVARLRPVEVSGLLVQNGAISLLHAFMMQLQKQKQKQKRKHHKSKKDTPQESHIWYLLWLLWMRAEDEPSLCERLRRKLRENGYAKLICLLQCYLSLARNVHDAVSAWYPEEDDVSEGEMELEKQEIRVDAGLMSLQHICGIISAFLCWNGNPIDSECDLGFTLQWLDQAGESLVACVLVLSEAKDVLRDDIQTAGKESDSALFSRLAEALKRCL